MGPEKFIKYQLWKIIRLSMRPAMGLCSHISLERILVYTILVQREFTVSTTIEWKKLVDTNGKSGKLKYMQERK